MNSTGLTRVKLSQLKSNPNNPRIIKDDKFRKLVRSITEFPEMLEARPIVCDPDGVVLGGNMRLKACREAGLKEVPAYVVTWEEAKQREFIIKDNVGFGEWDWDMLANEWDMDLLDTWGMPLPFTEDDIEEMKSPDNEQTEHPFATELDRESNYIVLKFTTDIDWIQAKTLFGLQTETAQRSNGKPWSSGIGRVLDGPKALEKVTNAS
jgi:hypothetical protein